MLQLIGLSRQELEALGQERVEQLLAEAFQREVQRKMTQFDAALDVARTMIDAGASEQGLALLREAAVVLSEDGVRQRDISRRFARMVFGPRSERLDGDELRELFVAFGGEEAALEAAKAENTSPLIPVPPAPCEPIVEPDAAQAQPPGQPRPGKNRPNHHGRRPLVTTCPVVEVHLPIPPEERTCAICGSDKGCIRQIRHETMEFEPARLVRHVEIRDVLSCDSCRKDVTTTPHSDSFLPGRRIGTSVVADVIVEKCSEAQPLHREHARYQRLGWQVPISTLEGAYAWGTDLLVPVANVVLGEILAHDYVRADSTELMVLDPKHQKGRFKGQVWGFFADGHVAFEFSKSWAADEIVSSFVVNPQGYKQVDDYKGYLSDLEHDGKSVRLVLPDRRLGCAMHIRRRFVEAFDAQDLRAAVPLEYFRQLYLIEADAKARKLSHDERLLLRQQASLPVLAKLRAWLDAHILTLLPKGYLGSATRYADQQWEFFERCFTRGDFEIDNGAIEREFRAIAIGRRNFLFTGSVAAAKRLCAAYTLVAGAKRLGIDPFLYIKDILDKLAAGWPIHRVAELTPKRWAAARAAHAAQQTP